MQSRTIDHVTSIRVDADRAENSRRIDEEERRQDRLWRLQEEAVASGKANAAVEMRWNDLMAYNMPQDLHREIEAQKKVRVCVALVGLDVSNCQRSPLHLLLPRRVQPSSLPKTH